MPVWCPFFKPDEDFSGKFVDVAHNCDLVVPLKNRGLVNANGIHPEDSFLACSSKMTQCRKAIRRDEKNKLVIINVAISRA